jgi:hypothetical protein
MEEDEGNGVLVEDASASQQEGRGVPQGPEPLFNPPAPDLGLAVSQAARFAFAPKRSHELALIRIGQYLEPVRTSPHFQPSRVVLIVLNLIK